MTTCPYFENLEFDIFVAEKGLERRSHTFDVISQIFLRWPCPIKCSMFTQSRYWAMTIRSDFAGSVALTIRQIPFWSNYSHWFAAWLCRKIRLTAKKKWGWRKRMRILSAVSEKRCCFCCSIYVWLIINAMARWTFINGQSFVLQAKRGFQKINCKLEVWSIDYIGMITASFSGFGMLNFCNFNYHEGKRACETAHGDTLSV